jgi:DNA polymerase V
MAQGAVRAGFPSPADDFSVKRQDLNELLITHPTATFFWRVRGTSMLGAGICDGDILVVNRALSPKHGDIVVAEVDNDFTVKYLFRRNGRVKLQAADPTFPDIVFEQQDGLRLTIVGVVTSTIKRFR